LQTATVPAAVPVVEIEQEPVELRYGNKADPAYVELMQPSGQAMQVYCVVPAAVILTYPGAQTAH